MKGDFDWIPICGSKEFIKKTWVIFSEDKFGKNSTKTIQPTSTHIGLIQGKDQENEPTMFDYTFHPIIAVNGRDGIEAQTWLRNVHYNEMITFTDDENSEYVALSIKTSKTIPNDPNDYYIFRVGEGVAENPPVQQLFYARLRAKKELSHGKFKRWCTFPIVSSDGAHIDQDNKLQVDDPCFHSQVGGLLLHSQYYNYYSHQYKANVQVYTNSATMDSVYTNDNIEFSTTKDPLYRGYAYSGYNVNLVFFWEPGKDDGNRNISPDKLTQNLSYVCTATVHPDDVHLLKKEMYFPKEQKPVKVKFTGVGLTLIVQDGKGVATIAVNSSHPDNRGTIVDVPYSIGLGGFGVRDVSHEVSLDGSYYKNDIVYSSAKSNASKDATLKGRLREYDWYPELNDMITTNKGHYYIRKNLWFITCLEYEVTEGEFTGEKIYDFTNGNNITKSDEVVRTKVKLSSVQVTTTPLAMPYSFERRNAHPASYHIDLKDILPNDSIHELLCISFLLISPTVDFKGHSFDTTGAVIEDESKDLIAYYPVFFLTTLTDGYHATAEHLKDSLITFYRRGSDLVLKSHYLRNEIVVPNVSGDKHLIKIFINHKKIAVHVDRRIYSSDISYIKYRRNIELFDELRKYNLMFCPIEDMVGPSTSLKCTGGWFTMSELRLELYNM